ncbi:monolysocardiolipin acyltransferase [Kwoniella heveanensis BCC8398]|uniref:Tafazzin family protein n=1 Tax=Kwoniella heveanensis BCC8398 TaxID=1296120 RepID=A0A1B9GWP0_9TREE|nr:monolysocardiolipin acyltransferase [Kwoniella heveanensis BCC8398]
MARPPTLSSALTLSTIALASRTFLRLTTKQYGINGLPILLDALRIPHDGKGKGRAVEGLGEEDPSQGSRRGIVTVCNHNSVCDDPMMWSLMPLSTYFPFATPAHTCRNSRWTLGASDIMFTKPLHRKFFDAGQVIETHRGGGIFQPAVDKAVKLLQDGSWIHIFPEGKVNQEKSNPEGGLLRFKWGVGRIIMDSKVMPEIIPMWISGFDQIMDERRGWPRPIPRPGAKISITVGQPLTSQIEPLVKSWREMAEKQVGTVGVGGDWNQESKDDHPGPVGDEQREVRGRGDLAEGRERDVRVKICDLLQEGVRKLGEDVERKEGRFEKGLWSHSTRRTV